MIDRRFQNYVRNRARRERLLDRRAEADDSLDVARLHRHRGPGYSLGDDGGLTDPAAIAEHHEEMQLLEQAVRERDEIDQRIFKLHFFERMFEPDVAVELGLKPAVVQHRWREMLKELKARFSGP